MTTTALLLTEHSVATWERRFITGDAPARLPYGVDALEQAGISVQPLGRGDAGRLGKVRDVLEHRSGMVLEQGLRGLRRGRDTDLTLALLETQGFLPGLLKRWGIPPYRSSPLVIWSCWLGDDLQRATPERRAWLKRRIDAADLITHLSRHETGIFTDLGIDEDRLFPVTYGVSNNFYVPGVSERDVEILAIGQDRGRDYGTLFEAVRGSNLTVDVVCKPDNLIGLDVPDNVRVHEPVSLSTYRKLLQRAQVVAVPTRELAYPTGSSVALEASASGCAVVVTGTRAMSDFFVAGHNAWLVEPGDTEGWRAALSALRDDGDLRARLGTAARQNVTDRFNADHMWRELAGVLRERDIVRR